MDTSNRPSLPADTELINQLLDLLPIGVLVNDGDGVLVFVNKTFVKMTGYKPERLMQLSYADQVKTFVPPSERHKVQGRRAFKYGEMSGPYEIEAITINGQRIPVSVQQYPLLGTEGRPAGSMTMVRDLRNTYERRRFSLTAEYVLNTMEAMVAAVDDRGRFILVNRAAERVLGVPRNDLMGTHYAELIQEEPYDRLFLTRSLENGEVFENVNAVIPYRGRTLDLLINCRQITDDEGRVMGACLVAADVSRLKHLQRVSALGQMAAVLSHELRNPLTVAKGNLQLLAMEMDEPLVSAALGELRRIESIITDVSATSRGTQIARASTSASAAVRRLASRAHDNPPASNVELVIGSLPKDEVNIAGISAHQLDQVLWNLFQNAAEAMQPAGGTVTVNLAIQEGAAAIKVSDTGPGIPPDLLERVFEPFFTTKEAGTGLGLTVCRNLVERSGGRIEVVSSAKQGTQLTVSFPLSSGNGS